MFRMADFHWCKYVQSQLNHCGKEYGMIRRYRPRNILDRNYYSSLEATHCLKFLDLAEACEGQFHFFAFSDK